MSNTKLTEAVTKMGADGARPLYVYLKKRMEESEAAVTAIRQTRSYTDEPTRLQLAHEDGRISVFREVLGEIETQYMKKEATQ